MLKEPGTKPPNIFLAVVPGSLESLTDVTGSVNIGLCEQGLFFAFLAYFAVKSFFTAKFAKERTSVFYLLPV